MNNDIKMYSSKDVAKRLSLEPVTVRKYSQMLEEHGYLFKKDEKKWRKYSEDDITSLEYLCKMKSMGKSLEESVQHIASLYRSSLNISKPDITLQQPENQFLEFMKRQEEFNKRLLEQIDQRDKNLIMQMNELQETKKQLASAAQKKWWQFWKLKEE
ncbi:MAG: DUF3967 domain-containing protein [Enterococcus sp.]|nr:DUF3967 domain-containing protein [Enterococcus sp.]